MAACAGPFADMQLPQRCMLLSDAFGVHNSMPLPHAHLLTCLGIGDDATYGEQSLMRALSLPLDYSINIPDPSHHLLHSCLPPPLETSSPSRRAGSPSLVFMHRCTLYPDLSSDLPPLLQNTEYLEGYGSFLAEVGPHTEALAVLQKAAQLQPDEGFEKFM
jgi:hypothetical protein